VNIRPVRFPPWAAGARPTTTSRASGSPKPGRGRAPSISRTHARSVGWTLRPGARPRASAERASRHLAADPLEALVGRSHEPKTTVSVVPTTRRKPPRPTVVCFVRHGTTATTGKVLPGRARGLHLSDQGLDEAAKAGEALARASVSAVYASPLERTRETASAISRRVGKPVVTERGLIECDFGAGLVSRFRSCAGSRSGGPFNTGRRAFASPGASRSRSSSRASPTLSAGSAGPIPARSSLRCRTRTASRLCSRVRSACRSICFSGSWSPLARSARSCIPPRAKVLTMGSTGMPAHPVPARETSR